MFVQNNKCDKSFVAKDNKIKVSMYNLDFCDVDFLLLMVMLVGAYLENESGVFIYQNIYNYNFITVVIITTQIFFQSLEIHCTLLCL